MRFNPNNKKRSDMKKIINILLFILMFLGKLSFAQGLNLFFENEITEDVSQIYPTKFSNYEDVNDSFLLKINLDKILYVYNKSKFDWYTYFEKNSNTHFNMWDLSRNKNFEISVPERKLPLLNILKNGDDVIGIMDSRGVLFSDLQIDGNVLKFTLPNDLPKEEYLQIDYFVFGSFKKVSSRWKNMSNPIVRKQVKDIDAFIKANFIGQYSPTLSNFLSRSLQYLDENECYPKVVIENSNMYPIEIIVGNKTNILEKSQPIEYKINNHSFTNDYANPVKEFKFKVKMSSDCPHCPSFEEKKLLVDLFGPDQTIPVPNKFENEQKKEVKFQNEDKTVRLTVHPSKSVDNKFFVDSHTNIVITFSKNYFYDYTYKTNTGHVGEELIIDEKKILSNLKKLPFQPVKIRNLSNKLGKVKIKYKNNVIGELVLPANVDTQIPLDTYQELEKLDEAMLIIVDAAKESDMGKLITINRKVNEKDVNEKDANEKVYDIDLTEFSVIDRLGIQHSEHVFKQIIRIYKEYNGIDNKRRIALKKQLCNIKEKNKFSNKNDFEEFLKYGIEKKWDTSLSDEDIKTIIHLAFP